MDALASILGLCSPNTTAANSVNVEAFPTIGPLLDEAKKNHLTTQAIEALSSSLPHAFVQANTPEMSLPTFDHPTTTIDPLSFICNPTSLSPTTSSSLRSNPHLDFSVPASLKQREPERESELEAPGTRERQSEAREGESGSRRGRQRGKETGSERDRGRQRERETEGDSERERTMATSRVCRSSFPLL